MLVQRVDKMAYEVFKRKAARVDAPTVSLAEDGRIAINAAAVRIFKKQRIGWVVLLWDVNNRRMAIKASQKDDKNAFAVSFSAGHSGVIRAKSFLSHIGWRAESRQRLPAAWSEKELMLETALPAEYLDQKA